MATMVGQTEIFRRVVDLRNNGSTLKRNVFNVMVSYEDGSASTPVIRFQFQGERAAGAAFLHNSVQHTSLQFDRLMPATRPDHWKFKLLGLLSLFPFCL
jgi:hypothetical protein